MGFKKCTDADLDFLRKIVSSERVISGSDIHDDFFHDEMPEYGRFAPDVLIHVKSTDEVSEIMKYASAENIPVTPRGAGTGLCGGCVATRGGIMLSFTEMNQILEVDESTLTAIVEPGVLLMQLAEHLKEYNLLYPPDPGEKTATIGGNSMTNAGGMRAVALGVTRDYIKGMEVVLADGSVVTLGGETVKNSSGYSLLHLMIGSEGTLGIVTKLFLKLIPLPEKFVSLLVPYGSIQKCLSCVPKLLAVSPVTLEFAERAVLIEAERYLGKQFPHNTANAYLIISFYGKSRESLVPQLDAATEICLAGEAIDVFISDTSDRQDAMWSARGAFLEAIKSSTHAMDECDVVLRIDKIAPFITYTNELSDKYNVRIRSFGHAGDGNLHIYVCKDDMKDEVWDKTVLEVMDLLYIRALEMGGQVSGEHGIGHAKRKYLHESLGDVQISIMRKIKNAFDPAGILNPGKIV